MSGHVIPVDAYADKYPQKAAGKTDEIPWHQAETGPKPPPDPAKECYAEYKNEFFQEGEPVWILNTLNEL